MAYFGVIFFANMGGGGGQNYSYPRPEGPERLCRDIIETFGGFGPRDSLSQVHRTTKLTLLGLETGGPSRCPGEVWILLSLVRWNLRARSCLVSSYHYRRQDYHRGQNYYKKPLYINNF